ncbi:shufflon system plasmid conjugative transfer pilus tip adhesin PilV [Trinickia dabaoshanensis]|uniref:Shufflon system plasmid conjugative transfer pilus tip adhesin PilV n=1 Tax=Trinickia dabaoshanensis TaxID=564714 RepID=A0A2N7VZL3_9BURK|nr:shufflon system plasmid conjugative transfer pilus tip adhesin PilV [Trinickia dabaoshanensis]PMS22575.1 shufflon system plasmid conjugative transfer pilus tip adhesin PilV [Trinickia dabaoshanensis]
MTRQAGARAFASIRRDDSRRRRYTSGFTLIEMLAVLALAAIMMAGLVTMINSSLEDTRGQQTALYQAQLTAAATRLVEQNYTALAAQATSGSPVVVKLNGTPYVLSNYLPSGVGGTNAYGQTPCLLIYKASSGNALQALLVTEGGQTIPDPELGYIAANAGAGGGAIQAINSPAGAAIGAFGSWKLAPPNPAGQSCTGTPTGVGHLASLISYDGTQAQNADYLYRVAVPGNPQANTMQVPIVLAQQTDYDPCTQYGAIAADGFGNVVDCDRTERRWVPKASYHWREAVSSEAALQGAAMPVQEGDVRVTLQTHRAYVYNGNAWQALAVDEAGNLALGNTNKAGDPCPPSPQPGVAAPAPNTTLVSTDSAGHVMSCQNGKWQTQNDIEIADSVTQCQIIMANANGGAGDYNNCFGQPGGAYTSGDYSFQSSNGTYSYTYQRKVTLDKTGIIVASTWAHMNDGLCNGPTGHHAQISQSVDIKNGSGTVVAHTESQSPTLIDDSGGINNSLTQGLQSDTYTIVVTTNWATYAGITTPWVSNFCGAGNTTIQNTPIAAGWTINSYY